MVKLKKIKKFSVMILMIIITLIIEINETQAVTAIVNANGVRVREEASTDSSIVLHLDRDAEVTLLDQEGDWYRVQYDETVGYIRKDLLAVDDNIMVPSDANGANETAGSNNETSTTLEEPTTGNQEQDNSNNSSNEVTGIEVHIVPTIFSEAIDTIDVTKQINIVKEMNHWLYIQYENKAGWVIKEKVENISQTNSTETTGQEVGENISEGDNQEENIPAAEEISNEGNYQERTAYVGSQSGVNLREEATTNSNILDTLLVNTEIKIIGEENDWYKVEYNSQEGYIAKQYVSDERVQVTTTTSSRNSEESRISETTFDSNKEGERIAEFALQFVGYPYVYGGTNPYTGADCTGFTYYVYNQCGYNLSRSCSVQAQSGTEISKENLQPGDLLIFNNVANTSIGHVGIYVGDGTFVHASSPERGILTDKLNSGSYLKRYVCARRIV